MSLNQAQELFKTKRIELPLEEKTNNPYPDLDLKEGEYLLIRYAGHGYFGSDYYRALYSIVYIG
ncbi:hypothetical protein MX850_01470 [Erysipelothrix sp. Poltava]|nr:hypothetical protein MX850_01470 [Erysipelothrix sp. Poltava]